nr:hypothetical protein CFP56_66858 [Quercus suber]
MRDCTFIPGDHALRRHHHDSSSQIFYVKRVKRVKLPVPFGSYFLIESQFDEPYDAPGERCRANGSTVWLLA